MTSVFDLPSAGPEPPTWDEFRSQLGAPVLAFTLDQRDLSIPNGLLACCRVVHQVHCEHHVALSLIGCAFTIVWPDGETDVREPVKQEFVGDVLARPRDVSAAVQATALMVRSTAEAGGGRISAFDFEVYLLNLTQAEMWRYLTDCQAEANTAVLEASDEMTSAEIEALPIVALADPGQGLEETARVMAGPRFKHAAAYARRVLVLPSEIGHDDQARYITTQVWGIPDEVPPAVAAILADPIEGTR